MQALGRERCTRLISAGHCSPLPIPPTTAATQATASVGASGEAEEGDPDREGAGDEHRPEGRLPARAKTMLPSTAPAPQAATSRP